MKLSSETWIVVAAVLLAALLAGQDVRNEWTLRPADSPDMVHFRIEHVSKNSKWSQSNDLPLANFRGLNPRQSGPAKFEYVEDAGSLFCQGRFSFGAGSGTYTFQVVVTDRLVGGDALGRCAEAVALARRLSGA